jgi:MoaA/NifB/PqqE/SkfB family radical SAM enzyme
MSLYDLLVDKKNNEQALTSSYFFELSMNARRKRYLYSILLELSPICNFKCPFCYVRKTPEEMQREGAEIIRFQDWKRLLDQLSQLGVINVGFTGGECMLHPDFVDIYNYAISKGFLVSMITNLSALTEEKLKAFVAHKPKIINVTLYGGSEDTYQRICGKKAYFKRVLENLDLLSAEKIPFSLQMTISKDNYQDLAAVYAISKKHNVPFHYNVSFFRIRQCTKEIQEENLVDDKIITNAIKQLDEYYETKQIRNIDMIPKPVKNTIGVNCAAGRSNAFISHRGFMQPCVSFDAISISTFDHSIDQCWKYIVSECDKIPMISECNGCIHWGRCQHCFAMHYADTETFDKPSPLLCFKRLHPEEAKRIEMYFAEHGKLPQVEG